MLIINPVEHVSSTGLPTFRRFRSWRAVFTIMAIKFNCPKRARGVSVWSMSKRSNKAIPAPADHRIHALPTAIYRGLLIPYPYSTRLRLPHALSCISRLASTLVSNQPHQTIIQSSQSQSNNKLKTSKQQQQQQFQK